jgi:8-oxo-dGTP pyrophosphatase MutT (NUDIX family)
VHPEESDSVRRFLELLLHPDAFQRTHLPGHITGSAFIVSEDFTQTLLVHHAKLNRWLQPGGHADGDIDVTRVALREANEETGLHRLSLSTPDIFDLDIHPIPARKDFTLHDHYDVRFLVVATGDEDIVVSDESFDVKWVPLSNLEAFTTERSLLRMRKKLKSWITSNP